MQPLTGKYAGIVYSGEDWSEHYSKKLAARSAVVLHALSRDWAFQDCERVLLDPANPGSDLWLKGDDGRPLGRAEPWKRLKRDYDRMAKRKRDHPGYKTKQDVRAHIAWLKMEAAYTRWQSRYDRDVLAAYHQVGTHVACDLVNVSTRQASIMAGCSQKAARNAIRRLIKAGWLERVADSRAYGPAVTEVSLLSPRKQLRQPRSPLYRLTRPKGCAVGTHITPTTVPGESNMSPYCAPPEPGPDHECWVQVGKLAMDLYMVLGNKSISGREAARRTAAAESSARLTLAKMADYGLALKTEDGWVRGPCDPDQVVENMGWSGGNSKRAMRALQYAKDRADFRTLGQDAALNDRRTREAARAPVRLKDARAKAASASNLPARKCSQEGCQDWDSGRGLCYAHRVVGESRQREAQRASSPLGSYAFKRIMEPEPAGVT
jgi:hypothetical protein